ncbi:hypothetical protein [Streptomyces sp. 184]|uniref:hypothetical protein n=1 Tax=Streptomyces sp. 184 TaxID=1827526 RepID=UPI003892C0CA
MNGMNGLATALVLAIASAAAYAGAAVLQERVAGAGREADAGVWAALTRGSWWLSVGLNVTGAALHVLALRYGPLTLIQPLGALTLVLALPLQAALRGADGAGRRRVGAARWRGAALTMAGLAGVLVLVRGGGHIEVLTPAQVLGTVAATAAALVALGAAARGAGPRAGGIVYATAAGIAFGAGSVLTQTVAVRPGLDAFTVLTGLAVAALAPAGLMLSQAAYRGGLGAPLATATLVNPAVSAAVGLTLLGERLSGGALGLAVALAATALATRGVLLLSRPDTPTATTAAGGTAPDQHAAATPTAAGASTAGQLTAPTPAVAGTAAAATGLAAGSEAREPAGNAADRGPRWAPCPAPRPAETFDLAR